MEHRLVDGRISETDSSHCHGHEQQQEDKGKSKMRRKHVLKKQVEKVKVEQTGKKYEKEQKRAIDKNGRKILRCAHTGSDKKSNHYTELTSSWMTMV